MSEDWRERNDSVAESFRQSARPEGSSWRVLCPFCQSSKTGRADYSMSVARDGRYYCHRCSAGGKLREPPAGDEVAQKEERTEQTPQDVIDQLEGGYIPLGYEPGLTAESLADARAYAAKRHLTPEMCRLLEVGAVLTGWHAGRIVIPVLDEEREWRGFVARDWTGLAEKPYLYSKGFSRDRFWNHAAVSEETETPLLVVEGVLDAVPYWPDAVAMLGKLSTPQMDALTSARRPVVFVFDGDAWIDARVAAMQLRMIDKAAGWVKLKPKTDPDQVDPEWLRAAALESIGGPL